MRRPEKAQAALARAEQESDEIRRSLWLAKAADHAIDATAVLVGGTAVNLHTLSYQPTDIDMCAYLDQLDRQALIALGFVQIQGDHFSYTFDDDQMMLLEFPDSLVDGEVMTVMLDGGEALTVITRESLVVDRIEQATDGSQTMFDEAVRLIVGVASELKWPTVEAEIEKRDRATPLIHLADTYRQVLAAVETLAD